MLQNSKESGFTLIEAMIATLIASITFIGVYTLTAYAAFTIKNSADRQKMQIIANEIFETIDSDTTNLANYNNLNLKDNNGDCGAFNVNDPLYLRSKYKWCSALKDSVGTAAATDVRQITVNGAIVTVLLQSRNNATEIVIKNTY